MGTVLEGTFVISWSQTELDGLPAAPLGALRVGTAWSWTGEPVRVDGPAGVLRLGAAIGAADFRKRAARSVRRMVGAELDRPEAVRKEADEPLFDRTFQVTDGRGAWDVTIIDGHARTRPLLMFCGEMPPRGVDLWVVRHNVHAAREPIAGMGSGVICFTPGTRILCEHGPREVSELEVGDRVQTKDNGCVDLLWVGRRRITGARLRAMPHLSPIRMTRDALGQDIPDESLLVSPDHRVVVRGARAEALFNAPEVLIAARDLVDHDRVHVERRTRGLSYIHLLLPAHEVVFANGVETESFHPAAAALDSLGEEDRMAIGSCLPDVLEDASLYGAFARRLVNRSEAAILLAG